MDAKDIAALLTLVITPLAALGGVWLGQRLIRRNERERLLYEQRIAEERYYAAVSDHLIAQP